MAKNFRRMLAMVLVMCMFVSALPMQALAAEQDGLEVTITPSDGGGESGGTVSDVVVSGTSESTGGVVDMKGTETVTSNTTKDSSGNTTTSTKTEVSLQGTVTENNIEKDATWQETTQESSTKNSNGEEIKSSIVIDGESTKKWDAPNGEDDAESDVTVSLIPGQTTTGEAIVQGTLDSETTTNENGTVVTDTTYEADRTVTATTSKFEVTVNDSNTDEGSEEKLEIQGVAPTYDVINGVREDKGGMFDSQFDSGATSKYADPSKWDMPEGADLRYVGTGEHSKYYVATAYVVYEKDEAGNTIYDAEGKPVIKEIRRYDDEDSPIITIDGKPTTELPDGLSLEPVYDNPGGSRPFIFMLMDKDKNKFYGYCCDLDTPANDGKYYSISNLEDSNYYANEESEQHIRSILMNGYLGTTDIPDEGNYALGSLELIKQKLIADIDSGKYPNTELTAPVLDRNNKYQPVLDENGEIVYTTKTMKEMVAGLTSGEALLATQAAIWSYANGHYNVLSGKDGSIVIDPDGYKWNHNATGNSKNGEAMDDFASAAVDFLYEWLINLETEEESTVVINDKNFIEDMSLTVANKVEEDKEDGTKPDLYNTELKFTLAFTPGDEDELFIELISGDEKNPEIITDANNNPIRIRKQLVNKDYNVAEGEEDKYLKPDDNGVYTLTGLQLHENTDFTFDLRLEGTQYLEQGVYFYQAVGGRGASQNFVGVAEGERKVDVSARMTISFDVDEVNKTVVKREWHHEEDPIYNPPSPPTPPEYPVTPMNYVEEDVPAPQVFRLNNDNGLEEIPEEPVPLAAPVITGDNSALWIAVVFLAICGMFIVNITDKKRQHETF